MRTLLAVCVLSLSTGCAIASLHDVEVAHARNPSAGTTRLYEVPAPRALEISRTILRSEGADAVAPGDQPGELLATIAPKIGYGAQCGVWVVAQDDSHSRVTVITKRTSMTVGTGLTETTFHDEFAKAVAAGPAPTAAK